MVFCAILWPNGDNNGKCTSCMPAFTVSLKDLGQLGGTVLVMLFKDILWHLQLSAHLITGGCKIKALALLLTYYKCHLLIEHIILWNLILFLVISTLSKVENSIPYWSKVENSWPCLSKVGFLTKVLLGTHLASGLFTKTRPYLSGQDLLTLLKILISLD